MYRAGCPALPPAFGGGWGYFSQWPKPSSSFWYWEFWLSRQACSSAESSTKSSIPARTALCVGEASLPARRPAPSAKLSCKPLDERASHWRLPLARTAFGPAGVHFFPYRGNPERRAGFRTLAGTLDIPSDDCWLARNA